MYYAVKNGRKIGIFNNWINCKKNVMGYKGAKYKKFENKLDAENYLKDSDELKQSNLEKFFTLTNTEINYIYTDGACVNNGKLNAKAGIGIYFGKNDPRNVSKKIVGKQTNNVAELSAIIETYTIIQNDLEKGTKFCIVTDSNYALNCILNYGAKCELNNWEKDIPNKELVKKIYTLYKNKKNVSFKHIKAHTSNNDIHSIGNKYADKLATDCLK